MIRIPLLHRNTAKPLQRCVEKASVESACSEHTVVLVMTHFLEAVADEVTKGRAVSIPGFGMFAKYRRPARRGGRLRAWHPAFVAGRPFVLQARLGVPPSPEVVDQLRGFRSNASRSLDRPGSHARAFSALAHFRKLILGQLHEDRSA